MDVKLIGRYAHTQVSRILSTLTTRNVSLMLNRLNDFDCNLKLIRKQSPASLKTKPFCYGPQLHKKDSLCTYQWLKLGTYHVLAFVEEPREKTSHMQ